VRIQTKLIAFQAFFVAVTVGMATVVYLSVQRADSYIERVSHTHSQLETITKLSLRANRYSEQIAEMLLFGEEGRVEFEEAKRDLEESFDWLEGVTRGEIESVGDADERFREIAELELIRRMRRFVARMHETALELLELRETSREEEARIRYFAEIEEDLDDRLQELIDLAIADEQSEVEQIDEQTRTFTRELLAIVAATLIAVLAASIGAVVLLGRAIAGPIAHMTEGVAAIGAGHLGHRIPAAGRDELALLARHFNRMAEQLESQRRELLRNQSELELKVGERTTQLAEANRRLRDLDRLRVLFLADVSHELRTPLTVLRGEAEVTLRARTVSADDYRDTLERVVDLSGQMGRLVDDLLFLTRAEADSIRFDMAQVPLQDVIEEALDEARMLAQATSNGIVARVPPEPIVVEGDRQRLKQTTMIALDNAIKYSRPRTPIEIELRREDSEAAVRVKNFGDAIPPEDLPYVFERFYRARRQGNGAGGSGLGLSIARWIVEKHGGSISITCPDKNATVLEFRLRLVAQPARNHSSEMV
jgi:two-component system OmpR family sensor kinase